MTRIRSTFAKRFTLSYVFLALLALDVTLQLSGFARGLATLLTLVLVAIGLILGFRSIRYLLRKTIWRLRNRLYVTYVFIGVVPVVLLSMLALAGMWIVVGQVAVYLISSELERSAALLGNPAEIIARSDQSQFDVTIERVAPIVHSRMAHFEVSVKGRREFHFPPESRLVEPPNLGDYTGFVRSNGQIYLWCSRGAGSGTRIVIAAPLTPQLIEKLAPPLGTVTLADSFGSSGAAAVDDTTPAAQKTVRQKKKKSAGALQVNGEDVELQAHPVGKLPPAYNALDLSITWFNPITVKPEDTSGTTGLLVETRPSAVLGAVFGSKLSTGQVAFVGFIVIASLLLVTELISLVIGISLTRTITGTVHELYLGTRKIAEGDFSYRIPVRGKDQLAALGGSFNNMSAQIEQLVVIAKEKERMESELEIAREVQNQLFPRTPPTMRTVKLTGLCRPARSCSGDYYDYLCLPDGNLALAIGDVAGKGISAALLMASIQSIMRTQLAAGLPLSAAAGSGAVRGHHSTTGIVAQLNKQLYANTSLEKYATFFFGLYEENSRLLTYTNAGHLPPLLIHRGEFRPLEVTGTVVGAFPMMTYGEETVQLESGDLLVAYTDGITEPENAYGQEFGEQRLGETILRLQDSEPDEIAAKVMEAVCEWSSAPELPDDMTIVIAQGIPTQGTLKNGLAG